MTHVPKKKERERQRKTKTPKNTKYIVQGRVTHKYLTFMLLSFKAEHHHSSTMCVTVIVNFNDNAI